MDDYVLLCFSELKEGQRIKKKEGSGDLEVGEIAQPSRMSSKQIGIGLYEFLIESELQHYYNSIKNDLKVCDCQNVLKLKCEVYFHVVCLL